MDRDSQVGGYRSGTTNVPESLNDFSRPWNKDTSKTQHARKENPTQRQTKTPPNLSRTDQQQHNPETHRTRNSPKANPTKGLHQSDRSIASVRPV
jgi:hypothetical protein